MAATETSSAARRRLFWLLAAVLGIGATIGLSEGFLRLIGFGPGDTYYMFPPNTERTFTVDTAVIQGVATPSRFSVNHLGLRGRPPSGEDIRVLVLGGSTVESLIVDEDRHWPRLLDQQLNAAHGNGTFWIGNAGRSGLTVFENILQLRYLPNTVGRTDLAIVLIGGNDMVVALREDSEKPESVPQDIRKRRTFLSVPSDQKFPDNLALVRLWKQLATVFHLLQRGELLFGGTSDAYTNWVRESRAERWNAQPFVDTLPDLTERLGLYRTNFEKLIDEAERGGIELVAVTQPQLHRAGQDEKTERTLGGWWGATSLTPPPMERKYYSGRAMYEAARLFDAVVLDICEQRRLFCIDAAGIMEPELEFYYDGVHYTDAGSERLAEIVASELQPFFEEFRQNR